MLTNEQISDIREHLEKAQNPIFFFDNDCDGLMSFILLRRHIGRGRGVAIKSFPELNESYIKKIEEFNSDYVFVLDKPLVSKEFLDEAEIRNLQVVWIDHHSVPISFSNKNVHYFNPCLNKNKSCEPTSYLAYKIANNKEDLWLALVGCIADNYMPEFADEFARKNPELWKKGLNSPFEILYDTDFGKLVMMLSFALKDRTTNVVSMINLLFKIRSPSEILVEDSKNFNIIKRYDQIKKSYIKMLEKAKKVARVSKRLVFFQYGGDLSISADLSNELSYCFPSKVIIIAYLKGSIANVSVRGNVDVRALTLKAIEQIEGATGGGHEHATGAKMNTNDLPKFKEIFLKELEKNR